MADQLSQANEIISRYVAEQLAQKVRGRPTRRSGCAQRAAALTMVFSDIVGFKRHSGRARTRRPIAVVKRIPLAEMTMIAEKYGATIDKFVVML